MDLLTTAQAAAQLGITPNRLRVLIRKKRLPAVRFGRDWQIREADLRLVADRKAGRPWPKA